MREKLILYVRSLFRYAPNTRQNQELEEEVLRNSLNRYDELVSGGMTEEAAYMQTVASIGDVKQRMEQPKKSKTGLIVGIICGVVALLLVSAVLGYLVWEHGFDRRGQDLEDRIDQWADNVENRVENWFRNTVQAGNVKPVFGSRVTYADFDRYQKGAINKNLPRHEPRQVCISCYVPYSRM